MIGVLKKLSVLYYEFVKIILVQITKSWLEDQITGWSLCC